MLEHVVGPNGVTKLRAQELPNPWRQLQSASMTASADIAESDIAEDHEDLYERWWHHDASP